MKDMMKDKIDRLIEISEYLDDNESAVQLRQLEERLEDKTYFLAVMGQFSAGKSRLINNILERQILPVAVTETTARITFIRYGEEDKAELVYADGRCETVPIDEIRDIWQNGQKSDKLADIECINISLKSDLLKDGLILIDTPGVNTIIDEHIKLTENIIVSSDRVLYVMGKPLTESDAVFIKAIKSYGTETVFVRTRMDELHANEENACDAIENERKKLSELSAKEAFFVSNEEGSEYYDGVSKLRKYISDDIAKNIRETIQNDALNKLKFIAARHEGRLLDRSRELGMILSSNDEEYRERSKALRHSLEALEKSLEERRERLEEKYDTEKKEALQDLRTNKESELKKITAKIRETSGTGFDGEYHKRISGDIKNACVRLRDGYVEDFNRLIRDNKKSLIDDLKNDAGSFAELSVYMPEIPDDIDEADSNISELRDRISALNEMKEDLEAELGRIDLDNQQLAEKRAAAEEEKAALEEAVSAVQKQLAAFPSYVERYITIEGTHSHEEAFKKVGNAIDWLTIFVPGEAWAKLGGKIINILHKGDKALKVAKAVKDADKLADGARILAKVANGVKQQKRAGMIGKAAAAAFDNTDNGDNGKEPDIAGIPETNTARRASLLDYLGLDYWFAKLGKQFDTPDCRVVDIEYKKEFKRQEKEIKDELKRQGEKLFEEKRALAGLNTKEEENRLRAEIAAKEDKAAAKQIEELKEKIDKEKNKAITKHIQEHYIKAADDNLEYAVERIKSDVGPDIDAKMKDYIKTYDFRLQADIASRKKELEDLEEKYNSGDKAKISEEFSLCGEYSTFIETEIMEK